MIFLNSALQILVSLSFIPYISFITNKQESVKLLPKELQLHISEISQELFILEITSLFLILILLGLIISILNDYYIYKISGIIKTFVQTNLFVSFLRKNYNYFIKTSSSEISKVIIEESNKIDQITFASLSFISNLLTLIVFAVFFFVKSFNFSVILLLLASLIFVFNKLLITKKVKHLGEEIGVYFEKRTKLLNESIEGIKEVKVNFLEFKTVNKFELFTKKYNNAYVKYNILLNINSSSSSVERFFSICGINI
jgi:ABC-type bacteriocin/lantibiotic exporter with double-glycine peptidase domain